MLSIWSFKFCVFVCVSVWRAVGEGERGDLFGHYEIQDVSRLQQ